MTDSLAKIATAYQRDWIASLRADLKSGAPYVMANADTPQEIFHAADLPVVTNQWWSAVISAKQQAAGLFDWMEAAGYHPDLPRYSGLGLIAELRGDRDALPWGGLPAPALLSARMSSDEHARIFARWSEATGAPLHMFSSPGVPDPDPEWWRLARNDWEGLYRSDRLDLMVAEMHDLIAMVEDVTDRPFDMDRLRRDMAAIDRQEKIFEECAEILATAPRLPMGISEQIPNVMLPQWHRGSDWAITHATALRDELGRRAAAGQGICETEGARMMWIGAGLWFDTGFYRAFEESHGAVFAWSMYLPFAADGYIRADHGDPLRTLAARCTAMNEQLHQPPWVNAWMVEQARRFRIDLAVMLVPENDRFSGQGSYFTRAALEEAGVKVVEIWADMVDPREWDGAAARAAISAALKDIA